METGLGMDGTEEGVEGGGEGGERAGGTDLRVRRHVHTPFPAERMHWAHMHNGRNALIH